MSFSPLMRMDYLLFWGTVLILAGAGLAWIGTHQLTARLRFAVVLLRALALGIVLLIALNPGRWVSPPEAGQPITAVLLDASASMATEDVDGVARWAAGREMILRSRETVPDADGIRVYTFSDELRESSAEDLASQMPVGASTDIIGAGQDLLSRFASRDDRLAGILILSDGRQTAVPNRSDFGVRAMAAGIPVATIALGGDIERHDLQIRATQRLVVAFGGQDVLIPVEVRNQGLGDLRVTVHLHSGDNQELKRVTVDLPDGANRQVQIPLSPRAPGFEHLRLSVDPLEEERVLVNNADQIGIATFDSPMKALLLEGTPHWDTKFLTQLVRAQPGMSVDAIYRLAPERFLRIETADAEASRVAQRPFPSSFEELAGYDLVIIGKGIEYFLTAERTAMLQRYLAEAGGCVLFARGKPYSGEMLHLATIEPVTWGQPYGGDIGLRPTLAGEQEGLFGTVLPPMTDPVWARLPDATCAHRISAVHGMARVLLESAAGQAGGAEGLPVLVSRRVGLGLSLVVNADGLWHWGFFPGDERISELYSQFWVQFFYWAATHGEFLPGQSFSLRVEPQTADPSDRVQAIVGARDGGAGEGPLPLVRVLHDGQAVEQLSVQEEGRGRWSIPLTLERPGLYTVELCDATTGAALGPRAVVERMPEPREQDDLGADPAFLAALAGSAGGMRFEAEAFDEALRTVLPGRERVLNEARAEWRSSWDRGWLLGLAMLLPGIEWTIRRRSGML